MLKVISFGIGWIRLDVIAWRKLSYFFTRRGKSKHVSLTAQQKRRRRLCVRRCRWRWPQRREVFMVYCVGHLSLKRSLRNTSLLPLLIMTHEYKPSYLCVYLCVCEHTYIQEYVYGRHYLLQYTDTVYYNRLICDSLLLDSVFLCV